MILEVLSIPDSRLRVTAKTVTLDELVTTKMQQFIDDLIETMLKKDGIGLAAVQVGKHLQIFTVATSDGNLVFVNPKITKKSLRKEVDEEGCLSVPNVYGTVRRSIQIVINALDRHGKPFEMKGKGLLARVLQHENDHLNGIVFIDKVLEITKGQDILKKLQS